MSGITSSKYQDVVIIINEKKYLLDKVVRLGKSGITANIAETDVNDLNDETYVPKFTKNIQSINDDSIIFYKQNGKFTVLSGRNKVLEAKKDPKFKGKYFGHILTSVAIKGARIES